MTTGHPTPRHLTAYATGAASAGVSLAVAAHLTYCPTCRARVAEREALAGALFAEEGAAPPPDPAEALRRLDDPAPATPPACASGPLPRVVARAVGEDFDAIRWRRLLPGIREYSFATVEDEEISLLRVAPGAAVPRHTHKGEELTVVFEGALIDRGHRYADGAVAIATPEVDHRPVADDARECICLAVVTNGLRFTGPFGRALNLFT